MDNNGNDKFQYTYSAKEQTELKKIREKYSEPEESKMDRLRRLDREVTKKATAVAIIFGVVGTLLLGLGMSLSMTEISSLLGSYEALALPIGIGVGIVGCFLVSLAYPVYNLIVRRERKKIAPEILRLADELIK